MRDLKRKMVFGVMALAGVLAVTGCDGSVSGTGQDGFFRAEFVVVNPTATPLGAQPGGAVIDPVVRSITGRGSVFQAVIDPPAPVPMATAISNSAGSSTGSVGKIPGPLPPIYAAPELTLDYPSTVFSDDCQAKAAEAAAKGLHLIVEGEGTVTYWGNASGGGQTGGGSAGGGSTSAMGPIQVPNPTPSVVPYNSGALVDASRIFSCELGTSICAAAEICVQPLISCPVGAMCVPPPCQCRPQPQPLPPVPAPSATPLLK